MLGERRHLACIGYRGLPVRRQARGLRSLMQAGRLRSPCRKDAHERNPVCDNSPSLDADLCTRATTEFDFNYD